MGLGKQVYVPDDNFENYLEAMNGDGSLNDYVNPLNIYSVTSLNLAKHLDNGLYRIGGVWSIRRINFGLFD